MEHPPHFFPQTVDPPERPPKFLGRPENTEETTIRGAMPMSGKFELFKDKKGEFRFRLKAGNGETILASEGYKDRSGAQNGIQSVRKNAILAARFQMRESENGKHYFVLKAGNNQVIGSSEMYEAPASCQNGVESVMQNAPDAAVADMTA